MIDDSYVWKDRLRRGRAVLRRKLRDARTSPARAEAAFVEVEAFVFLTGYIVRKLIEAKKLSDELESASMKVLAYPARPDYPLDFVTAHKIDRGYDFASPSQKLVGLRALCNLLIHSFVFMPSSNDDGEGWTGFFVNSETRNHELLFISAPDFDVLVDEVIRDDVVTMSVDRIRGRVKKSRYGDDAAVQTIALNADRT